MPSEEDFISRIDTPDKPDVFTPELDYVRLERDLWKADAELYARSNRDLQLLLAAVLLTTGPVTVTRVVQRSMPIKSFDIIVTEGTLGERHVSVQIS